MDFCKILKKDDILLFKLIFLNLQFKDHENWTKISFVSIVLLLESTHFISICKKNTIDVKFEILET